MYKLINLSQITNSDTEYPRTLPLNSHVFCDD